MANNNSSRSITGLATGTGIFLVVLLLPDFGVNEGKAQITAAVALLMAAFWITEAIPLATTSLIPLILFPLLGVLPGSEIASAYINSTIFLFMGGFIIAAAMEKWDLHKRVALYIITKLGRTPSTIILGFMIAAAVISMWISNTATAVMLLPIGLAVLNKVEDKFGKDKTGGFAVALMLGIAYACSIGGVATIIGTPPNLVFQRVYKISFPEREMISFGEWMIYGIPIAVVMLGLAWVFLTKVIYRQRQDIRLDRDLLKQERKDLGKISYEEKTVLVIFLTAAFLWVFRKNIETGLFTIPGWSSLFPVPEFIDDGTVAIMMSLLFFIIPAKNKKGRLLENDAFKNIPWEIILLFGGGFALAHAFVESGLSEYVASVLKGLSGLPVIILIAAIAVTITFLTELTSNTATAQIFLPILAALSTSIDMNPVVLMMPAALSASMAFMMPVATPPNAIVFGSGRLRIPQMARAGILLNITGTIVITLFVYFLLV